MMSNAAYDLALKEIGTLEWADGSNPKVVEYFADVGHPEVGDDSTAWCAAFVGAMLHRAGYRNTGSLAARSYLDWGMDVEVADAQPGDIVIIRRGSSWQGHVFFLQKIEADYIWGLGGNQKDSVCTSRFSRGALLGIRRPIGGWKPSLTKERSTPAKSTTVQASAVQIASGAGAGIAAIGALDGYAQLLALAFAGIVILAGAWIMRERLKKWADGVR